MTEEFDAGQRMYFQRDGWGRVTQVRPVERNRPTTDQNPQQAAVEFLTDHAPMLGIDPDWFSGQAMERAAAPAEPVTTDGIELRHASDHRQFDTTTVLYQQTWHGLEVWRCGVTVTVRHNPARVVAVANTTWPHVEADLPRPAAVKRAMGGQRGVMSQAVGATLNVRGGRGPSRERTHIDIVSDRLVVYRYDAADRLTNERPVGDEGTGNAHVSFPFPLPGAPHIADGSFRVAREVIFRLLTPPRGVITWIALVDVETADLLYLRAFTADVDGMVFPRDPLTAGGTAGPGAASATLNPFRTTVTLQGLDTPVAGTEQALTGDNVAVRDFEIFTAAPPTEPVGTNFSYDARTNDFAAVNAYYHTDRFFRLVTNLGFVRASYFNGTTFPVPVDHRGRFLTADGIEVNASCNGNGTGGIGNVDFELADLGDTTNPIGIANDWRIVLHELGGHGILYDAVNAANFGFAHSAGDSFAAILSDPDSLAADRFLTFPWVAGVIGRRHDRAVGNGWAWGGSRDDRGYQSEEILCTSHFRIYRSLGGDAGSLPARQFAARVVAYLMLRAVGTLTPSTNPANAGAWVDALLAADAGDWTSEALAGGAYGKVIRWAFEKQGLYQAPGAPTPVTREGRPPAQDVYIDDGRHGEYQYQPVHWDNQNVWNRRFADDGTLHEDPWLNRTNFAYCRVRNRGTQTATGVVVRAFHTDPGAGLIWPDDWVAMTTAQLTSPDIPPGGEVVVGPFSWTPTVADHECLLMIASSAGDPSNVDALGPGESIAEWRLVPHDNNIGQRNVHPVPAAGGAAGIMGVLNGREFTVRNPLDRRVKIVLAIAVPPVLAERGWSVTAASAGGVAFSLASGGERRVRLAVAPGTDVGVDEVAAAASRDVVVSVLADGVPIGGMTYRLDPDRVAPMPQDGDACDGRSDCAGPAGQLLRCLDLPDEGISDVRLRRVGIDIEIDRC